MHSLLLFSSLALLTPVLAAPGVQYSLPTSTSTPTATAAPNAVALPTPLFTMPSLATIGELKRRGAVVLGMPLDERQITCSSGTYTCSDSSGCCKTGTLCFGYGYCYDPSVNMDAQISSILAEYTGVDYLGIQSMLTNTYELAGSSTGSYPTGISTNSNSNSNNINVGGGDPAAALGSGGGAKKKKSNTGMIAGIIVAVVIVIVAVVIAVWLFRRTKRNKEAQGVIQQPMTVPYNSPTPPYPPSSNPDPFEAYGAVANKDKIPYYNNQSVPPNTVEMPANQSVHGQQQQQQQQQHYQPPALPAAGIVEASGDSAYHSASTGQNLNNNNNYGQQPPNPHQVSEMSGQSAGGHLPGHPPPNQTGTVYEMDSRHYGQN